MKKRSLFKIFASCFLIALILLPSTKAIFGKDYIIIEEENGKLVIKGQVSTDFSKIINQYLKSEQETFYADVYVKDDELYINVKEGEKQKSYSPEEIIYELMQVTKYKQDVKFTNALKLYFDIYEEILVNKIYKIKFIITKSLILSCDMHVCKIVKGKIHIDSDWKDCVAESCAHIGSLVDYNLEKYKIEINKGDIEFTKDRLNILGVPGTILQSFRKKDYVVTTIKFESEIVSNIFKEKWYPNKKNRKKELFKYAFHIEEGLGKVIINGKRLVGSHIIELFNPKHYAWLIPCATEQYFCSYQPYKKENDKTLFNLLSIYNFNCEEKTDSYSYVLLDRPNSQELDLVKSIITKILKGERLTIDQFLARRAKVKSKSGLVSIEIIPNRQEVKQFIDMA